jgi:hypothetical protein
METTASDPISLVMQLRELMSKVSSHRPDLIVLPTQKAAARMSASIAASFQRMDWPRRWLAALEALAPPLLEHQRGPTIGRKRRQRRARGRRRGAGL